MKHAQTVDASATTRFSAEVRSDADGAFVVLPLTAGGAVAGQEGTMVEGTMDAFPFRAPLEPAGAGGHRIRISEALLKAVRAEVGGTVDMEITRVGDEPEVRVPSDWREALAAAPQALALYEKVTPMARREWVRWVASAKLGETRERRIDVGIDKLTKGMRRPCCFPGINWVTKGLVTAEETWVGLPGSKGGGKDE